MELELAGVVRYTHYSLMVFGYTRIPMFRAEGNADESMAHANKAGEFVTMLGGIRALRSGPLLETHKHDIGDILRESLEQEKSTLDAYYELLFLSRQIGRIEEYAAR
jgi:bacterioferritin